MAQSIGPLVGILGPASDATQRVVDILTSVHGFRDYDMCGPAKAALVALDPLLLNDTSLREHVEKHGWPATLRHRLHGPEATRLLETMRAALPGTILPSDVWTDHVQACELAAASMLGPAPVVVHDVRPGAEADWVRERGGRLWEVDATTGAGDTSLSTNVSDTALGRRIDRELAAMNRALVGTGEEA